jgi:long-chain acyl-CoA synthetase
MARRALSVDLPEPAGPLVANGASIARIDACHWQSGSGLGGDVRPLRLVLVYNTASLEQIEYVVRDAACRVVVTEPQFLGPLLEVRERVDTLRHIVVIGDASADTLSVSEFEALGDQAFDFEGAWRAVGPDDVLCVIYTSGTTGPPKGVQLTHRNMMCEWRAVADVVDLTPGGRSISFLPTAHVAGRWAAWRGLLQSLP